MNKEEQAQSFAVSDESVVIIETSSGDAEVEGWEEARVEVEPSGRAARVHQEGATLRISPKPAGAGDVKVKAPRYSSVVLRSVSGDARVKDITGGVNVQTTSGDVKIQGVRGDLKAHSVSGDLKVRQSSLRSVSIDTVSGDVEIETTLEAQGEYDVRSVSGDLVLWLPAGQGCTIYSASLSGDFECELPHEIVEQGRRKLEARINGGGPAFNVRSTSGDVSVKASKGPWAEEEPLAAPKPASRTGAEAPWAEKDRPEPSTTVHETKPLPTQGASVVEPFAVEESRVPRAGTEETPPARGEESTASQRMEILQAIEEGRISVSEGLAKLRTLD